MFCFLKDGVKKEDAKAEAHNNYIDIQVCPTGKEELGWKPRNKAITPKEEYNAEKDVTFFKDPIVLILFNRRAVRYILFLQRTCMHP